MMSQVLDYFLPIDYSDQREFTKEQLHSPSLQYVLFIENDSDFTMLLRPAINSEHEVLRASSVAEAYELLQAYKINLIVWDCVPAEFETALPTLRRVCELQGEKVPILIMSSYEDGSFKALPDDEPFTVVGHIRKTFSLVDLIKQLNTELQSFFES